MKPFVKRRNAVTRLAVVGLVALVGLAGQACLQAQEAVRTLERTYEFDNAGNANVEFNFQLGAAQWAKWKDQYGDHPDLMLRNVKYELAAAVIDDFSLEKNEVHRKATAKIKARAMAKYRGNGQFEILVPKNMKLVSGSGREWAFTSSALEEGGLVNITDRAKLPTNAQNAHLTTGNDFDLLVYSLDVSPSKPKTFLYLGIVSLLAAAGIGAMAFKSA
jgi:hypothetical protein